MTTYIAGPMSGLPDFNYPLFHAVAAELRSRGVEVRSPAEHDHGTDEPWDFYMREGLRQLLDCHALVLLPGWTRSKGAKLEYHVACALGMHVTEWLPE